MIITPTYPGKPLISKYNVPIRKAVCLRNSPTAMQFYDIPFSELPIIKARMIIQNQAVHYELSNG